jgi:hypothetical protein
LSSAPKSEWPAGADQIANKNTNESNLTPADEVGNLSIKTDELFCNLHIEAARQYLNLHRQSSLGPDFGLEIFIISKRSVLKTFDNLLDVESWLYKAKGPHRKAQASPSLDVLA